MDERWVLSHGSPVFLRAAGEDRDGPVVVHVHGFAISGSYMVPTAEALAGDVRSYVPDLPGFGRSPRPDGGTTIPQLADQVAGLLDSLEVERATIVGNSLGCAVLSAFAVQHPDRIERAVLVSPAGGLHNQPLLRALSQLARDAPREPVSMATVAVPDYLSFGLVGSLRLFVAMTRFPAFDALMHVPVPVLAVLGARDPLLPPPRRVRQVAEQLGSHASVAVIRDAAHAINYSHPAELAGLIRRFLRDEPLVPSADGIDPGGDGLSPIALLRSSASTR